MDEGRVPGFRHVAVEFEGAAEEERANDAQLAWAVLSFDVAYLPKVDAPAEGRLKLTGYLTGGATPKLVFLKRVLPNRKTQPAVDADDGLRMYLVGVARRAWKLVAQYRERNGEDPNSPVLPGWAYVASKNRSGEGWTVQKVRR